MKLSNRVALVTGAGSGIGRASAELFAREGALVGLLARTEEELKEVQEGIERAGGKAEVLRADVSDAGALEQCIGEFGKRHGAIHVVFANAGVNGVWAPLEELKVEEFEQTVRINLLGTFHTLKFAYPFMQHAGGSILVCSSVNGNRIFSNSSATAYSCTKAAQVAMAKMLAVELAKHKIRVNVICPGAIDTEIEDNTQRRAMNEAKIPVKYPEGEIPLTGRQPGKAEDVAQLALFLAADASKHITGTEVYIDGAQSLLQG